MKTYYFRDLVTLKYGKDKKIADAITGTNPILGTGGVIGTTGLYLYNKPSVLIGRKGSIEETYFIDKPFWTIDTLFYTEINEEIIYPKWFYYLTKRINFKRYQEGTGVPSLTVATLNKIKVNIPSKEEQRKTLAILNPIDEKIELNHRLINDLEEYSQLLFHKWFVDFNFPNENGEPYKDSGGEMVVVDGKMIPKSWSLIRVNELAIKHTESINPSSLPGTIFKYFSIPAYDERGLYMLENGENIQSGKFTVPRNSILVSKLNPWFKRVIYPFNIESAICSTDFVVLVPNDEELREFLFVLVNSDTFIQYCSKGANGTDRKSVV